MKKRHGILGAALAGFGLCLVATTGLPIIAIGSGTAGSSAGSQCGPGQISVPSDGSPSILGPSTLTYAELTTWWASRDRGQPSRLQLPIDEVITAYLSEGDAEGVRGDVALAQALHETGNFTSTDTSISNFAGIGHPDGANTGQSFPDAASGVRAHIQLLKKYVEGNGVQLVHPDVAPDAGHMAQSWGELAGRWASSPDYWTGVSAIYDNMLAHVDREVTTASSPTVTTCGAQPNPGETVSEGELTEVRGIVVHTSIARNVEDLLAAAEADGLALSGWGYRSYDRQVELRRAHCGSSEYAIYRMPASQCSPPTAPPGSSMHELGLAIDFQNCSSRTTQCWRWLNEQAERYGLFNLPSEPWHWSIDGS